MTVEASYRNMVVAAEDGIGRIRLNRPEAGNRLGTEDMRSLMAAFEDLERERPAAIVLEAAGEDFCLGREAGGDTDPDAARASLATVLEITDRIRRLSTLVLAAVRGRAVGLGAGLVLHADLAIAGESATISFDEVERGFPPTLVMTYVERFLPRKLAREMIATGRPLAAREALAHGTVNSVVGDEKLPGAVAVLTEELAARDMTALTACKPFLVEVEELSEDRRAAHGLEAGVGFFTRAARRAAVPKTDADTSGKERR